MAVTSINPATGRKIREYPTATKDDIEKIIARASERFTSYRNTSFAQRADWMNSAAALLKERTERYAKLMTQEMGKPIAAARSEVEKCAWVCEYYAKNAETFLGNEVIETDASKSYVAFEPLGPVLAIMPWNFPLWQCFRFAAPGLMAGNVGLLKHASNVPGCSLAIQEVFADAGFPDGCFQSIIVESDSTPDVVEQILTDHRVAAATLTGSEGAGRSVGRLAGEQIKHVVLELGGSDPFVVMPSADMKKAIDTAVTARTINNGQSCIAAKRFILHEDIAHEFENGMKEKFEALKVGDPSDESVDIGPLAEARFVDDLEKQVKESIDKGARVVVGSKRGDGEGSFYLPTILADVAPGMPAYDDETFGPVAALISVKNLDEAIATANDTKFGLGSAAFTGDDTEKERFIAEIEAGCVFINGMVKSDPRLPFGGVKASGIGRELGEFGIREFVNKKTVWIG